MREEDMEFTHLPPCEMFVLYDEQKLDPGAIGVIIREEMGADNKDFCTKILGAGGGQKQYYELKNMGARHASGDLLIFIDSDVVPESGWLRGIIAPFARSEVQVVGGNTYVDPYNLYAKTFALFWFFPLRDSKPDLRKTRSLFANNIAFRRKVFQQHPFPAEIEGIARGSCWRLAVELRDNDIAIYRATAAQVSHPPPRAFAKKALSNGRDRGLRERESGQLTLLQTLGTWCQSVQSSTGRVVNHRHEVALSRAALPAAIVIVLAYHSLSLFGQLLTRIAPELMKKRINEF